MRAFVSLLLVIIFINITLILIFYDMKVRKASADIERDILMIKNYNVRESELKRAIVNTMRHSLQDALLFNPDMDSANISKKIAHSLAALEKQEASKGAGYYNTYHLDVNFWCGFLGEDIQSMKDIMLDRKISLKCQNCKDFDEMIPKYSIEAIIEARKDLSKLLEAVEFVPACTPFISVNKLSGTIYITHPPVEYAWSGDNPVIGVSILDTINNISSVVVLPEGTVISLLPGD